MPNLSARLLIPMPLGSDTNVRAARLAELTAIETNAASVSDLTIHGNLHTGTHGAGAGEYIALTSRPDQLPAWADLQGAPASFAPSAHAASHAYPGGGDPISPLSIRAVDRTGDTMSGTLTISAGGVIVQTGGLAVQAGGVIVTGAADTLGFSGSPPALVAAGVQTGLRSRHRANSFDSVNHTRDFVIRPSTTTNDGLGILQFLTALDGAALSEVGRVDQGGMWSMPNVAVSSYMEFAQIARPANPAAGRNRIYPKADGNFYMLDSTGTERPVGSGAGGYGRTFALMGV